MTRSISRAVIATSLVFLAGPAAVSAHLVSQSDPRGDAKGPFDLRSTSLKEDRRTFSLVVNVKQFARIPSRPPGMPCVAFDYKAGPAVDRVACPIMAGNRYELREAKSRKLVTTLRYGRPVATEVQIRVPGRFLDSDGPIRWRAFLEGSGDTLADDTRWRSHAFAD